MAHGWKNFVSNGRPGVDVFFVISGYLISHIIFKERNNGTFTIWKFYERRIKRLVPALLFYLIFVILYLPRKF
jgi:peptidoglycan/LPS O-acetylase OafA/YrhL